jgi:hypothetical protein
MRCAELTRCKSLFTVTKLDDFVPADHPVRAIRHLVNKALAQLNGLFNRIYADKSASEYCPRETHAHAADAGVLLGEERAQFV